MLQSAQIARALKTAQMSSHNVVPGIFLERENCVIFSCQQLSALYALAVVSHVDSSSRIKRPTI